MRIETYSALSVEKSDANDSGWAERSEEGKHRSGTRHGHSGTKACSYSLTTRLLWDATDGYS